MQLSGSALAEPLLPGDGDGDGEDAPPAPSPADSEDQSQPAPCPSSRAAKIKKGRVIFAPFPGAASEASSYPHNPNCMHCHTLLLPDEARWGSGLCNLCYAKCTKSCTRCGSRLELKQLHWNSGLCDACYDAGKRRRASSREGLGGRASPRLTPDGMRAGVRVAIGAQVVFYMAPGVMSPSLFLQIRRLFAGSAATGYAAVLTTTTVVAMAAPIPLGMWADARGEREVYRDRDVQSLPESVDC